MWICCHSIIIILIFDFSDLDWDGHLLLALYVVLLLWKKDFIEMGINKIVLSRIVDFFLWEINREDGVRPQCLCACWPNASSRFNTPFLFSPVVPYSWRSKLSLSYLPEISPRTLNVSRCPSTSEIWCRNWKSCDRSCPSSSRRRDTAVSRSHVRRSLRWDPGLFHLQEIHFKFIY